jgi:predicted secreted protein
MNERVKILSKKLRDERSQKVIFVSHCILNENTRYLGGAFRKGCIDEVVDGLQAMGVGIVQMPCPERECWGGVLKKDIMRAYSSKGTFSYKIYTAFLNLWIWNTKRKYRKLANKVVEEMRDYKNSGFEVMGVVGVDGSPSCGVNKTLDIRTLFAKISEKDVSSLTREETNKLVAESLTAGKGYFVQDLQNCLKKWKLDMKFYAHSLLEEMKGKESRLKIP